MAIADIAVAILSIVDIAVAGLAISDISVAGLEIADIYVAGLEIADYSVAGLVIAYIYISLFGNVRHFKFTSFDPRGTESTTLCHLVVITTFWPGLRHRVMAKLAD